MTPAHAKGISLRFKIRSSAIHQIMTNGRSKSDPIGQTCITYLQNWILEQPEFLGRKINEFSSRHTKKGNAVERDSLDFIGQMLYDGAFFEPNTKHFYNDYITGTPDQILSDHTFDNKATWSAGSFPFFESEPEKAYFYQGQGYMILTGVRKHKVIHTLMDTPEDLIKSEAYRIAKDLGFAEPTDELYEQTRKRLTFSDLPDERRIKVFKFDYDSEIEKSIISRVEECREYIYKTLLNL
jgi:hypothetical protein